MIAKYTNYTYSVPDMSPEAGFSAKQLDCPYQLPHQHCVVLTGTKQRQPEAKEEIKNKLCQTTGKLPVKPQVIA